MGFLVNFPLGRFLKKFNLKFTMKTDNKMHRGDAYRPLEQQRLLVGDELFQVASFSVADPRVAAELLGLVAVPGLACVKVCEVTQRLLVWRQAHVAHSGLNHVPHLELTLEIHPIGSLFPQALQHGYCLTGVHHRDLHLRRSRPEEREQGGVTSISVVHHCPCHSGTKLWRMQPGQKEISTVVLRTTVEVVHLDQHLQLAPHVPRPTFFRGQDGEHTVHWVTCQVQGNWFGARQRSGPGNRVQQVALLQFIFWGGFLSQVSAEGAVVMKCREAEWEDGGLNPALQLLQG